MAALRKTKIEWIKFTGNILKFDDDSVTLLATDGSEGIIKVNKSDFKRTGNELYILLGCKCELVRRPRQNPQLDNNNCKII